MKPGLNIVIGVCIIFLFYGCGENRTDGRGLYESYCMACHGMQGKGNGPAAPPLNPKPADFTSGNMREKCKKDRFALSVAIREGGMRKNAPWGSMMPSWKNLTEKEIFTLVTYICDKFDTR